MAARSAFAVLARRSEACIRSAHREKPDELVLTGTALQELLADTK
jgi:hypothetical protein